MSHLSNITLNYSTGTVRFIAAISLLSVAPSKGEIGEGWKNVRFGRSFDTGSSSSTSITLGGGEAPLGRLRRLPLGCVASSSACTGCVRFRPNEE